LRTRISDIPTRTLKDDTDRLNDPADVAAAQRAVGQWFIRKALKLLEFIGAGTAAI